MDTSLIILGVALIIVLYIVFVYLTSVNRLANRVDLAQVQPPITVDKLTKPDSPKYSYETWMYVYGSKESAVADSGSYIFYRPSEGTPQTATPNIGLKLMKTTPTLQVEYTVSTTTSAGVSSNAVKTLVITDNFPFQSWVHVIISVDNNYMDVYMNGKLVKSIKDNIATPSSSSSLAYGVSKTYLAKFTRNITPTDPQTAWNNYLAGNGENPIKKFTGNYNLALTFKNGDANTNPYTMNILGGN